MDTERLARIEAKLDKVLSRLEVVEEQGETLRVQTGEIHQFVPFVGWLDSSRRSLSSIFSLSDQAARLLGRRSVGDQEAKTPSVAEIEADERWEQSGSAVKKDEC